MSRPRIGLVGGRRRRQGLGPFVARDMTAAGAHVAGFVTTTATTRDATAAALAAEFGIEARGYLDVETMLATESLDALAILSPSNTHAGYLAAARAAGLHVLCDKPLVWDCDDLAGEAARVVDAFENDGLLLWENCQWPYTLPAYERLFPGSLERPPQRFAMAMQPVSRGVQAFGDSLPHSLSLLQTLAPGAAPKLGNIRFESSGRDLGDQIVRFDYCTDQGTVAVETCLSPTDESPRAAAYAVDGRWAHRRITGADYELSFVGDDGHSVPLPDPLTQLVADFVDALRGPAATPPKRAIRERAVLLGQLVEAYDGSRNERSERANR